MSLIYRILHRQVSVLKSHQRTLLNLLLVVVTLLLSNVALASSSESKEVITPKAQYETMLSQQDQQKYKDLLAIYQSGKVLTPSQVSALNEYNRSIEAAKNRAKPLAKNRRTFLYNDDHPPSIYIARNHLTNIQFVDNAGNPYPIQDYNISDTTAFNVYQRGGEKQVTKSVSDKSQYDRYAKTKKTSDQPDTLKQNQSILLPVNMRNSITIDGATDYATGDLIVYLEHKQMPVHIFLQSSNHQYDYQVNISVDGLTQESLQEVSYTGSDFTRPSNAMMQFLNGTAPDNAVMMNVSVSNAMVWKYNHYFYIRTKSELQSPAYIARASTANGFTVFQIVASSHVLSLKDHGRLITASISEPVNIEESWNKSGEGK